jgi:hypothetical protein
MTGPSLLGIDFSSAPSRAKPICVARGHARGAVLVLEGITTCASLDEFTALLRQGPWIGGFDLPFGLPRELVLALGWPQEWPALMRHYAGLGREEIRALFKRFCDARPVGHKFAHRACDVHSGASPSMKWVNPPVAFMLHAGVPLLIDTGAHLPGLLDRDASRVALEAYPGLLARELIGRRSYKSDTVAKQSDERLIARKDLVEALEQGRSRLGLRLKLSHAQRDLLAADARGDRLDAVLCLMQAAWAAAQPNYGLPEAMDPLEGWIITCA